jgi:hypothetical protein
VVVGQEGQGGARTEGDGEGSGDDDVMDAEDDEGDDEGGPCVWCRNSGRLVEAGACGAVLDVLGLWAPHHAGIADTALTLLVRLSRKGGDQALAEGGALPVVLGVMREALGDLGVQACGLQLLSELALVVDLRSRERAEAVARLWEAWERHRQGLGEAMVACVLNLSSDSAPLRALLGETGACEWAVGQLRASLSRPDMVLAAIGNLVLDPENRARVVKAGAVELLLKEVRHGGVGHQASCPHACM